MNNSEYWRGRFSLLEHSTYKTAQAALREMEALYRQALYRTRKELDSWCTRFADDNGVSLTEARRLLGAKELEEFRWDVAKYIETAQKAGLDETWQRQLRNASARVHISRLEAVETQIRQQIEELYAGQETQLTEAVRRAADDAYTGALQETAMGLDIRFKTVSLDKGQLDALTAKAWTTDDRTFRDRCWTNKNSLVQAVHKGLTQGLLRGDSPAQLTDAIAKQFDVDRYKAGRLVYTETAYYSALAEKQGFKDLGVEKVEIIGTLDGSTCSICGQLDGKEIPLAQYEPGVTVPPFHPRCRCTTAPVIPEDFADGLRIARDEDGEEYYLPAGTKWTEWKSRQKTALYQDVLKGTVIPSDETVQNIPTAQFSEMTESQALSLRDAHRSVLQLVLDSGTPDHEAGCFLMSDFSHTEPFISKSSGSIQFPATPQGAVGTIHSHPTGTSFSLGDILQFASDADSSIMTVVGNNGSVYLFQKTEDFDISGYLLFLNEQMELFPNRQEDAQEYLKFMEAVLHGAEKYGFDYKAF